MLDFSWSHILIVLIVALVVVGPKDLPRLMRIAGQWAGKARAMANEFRRSFDEMARQAELDELRAEIEALKKDNPISDVTRELNQPVEAVNAEAPPPSHDENMDAATPSAEKLAAPVAEKPAIPEAENLSAAVAGHVEPPSP